MKKLIFSAILVLFSLGLVSALGASIAPSVEQPAADAVFPVEIEALDADTVFPIEVDFGFTPFPRPHCGDYCETPGQSRGCIDSSGANWRLTTCTCVGNTWSCNGW